MDDDVRLYSFALVTLLLALILLLILVNCCLCNKQTKFPVVHDTQYFDNILLLLERQEAVERNKAEHIKLFEATDLRFLKFPRQPPSKPANFPRRQRSVSANQTDKLVKLKEDLEHFKVDHGVQIQHVLAKNNIKPILRHTSSAPVHRRTWDNFDTQFQDLLDAQEEKDSLLDTAQNKSKSSKSKDFSSLSWKRAQGMETTV